MLNLEGKNAKEKAQLKSKELAKVKIGKYTKYDFEIEIIGDIEKIEVNGQHGIELFAKVFKGKKQCGFGKDGSIEIERFRFFNPPVLVDDENGDIIRENKHPVKEETIYRKLRYDPEEAIKQSLTHIIGLVVKDGNNIVKGKIGNTTSTFYPAAGNNSPVDGYVRNDDSSWTTCRTASDGDDAYASDSYFSAGGHLDSGQYRIWRGIFLFNTAAIPDTDIISSGTISLYAHEVENTSPDAYSYTNVFSSTPASNSAITTADYDQIGSTKFSSNVSLGSAGSKTYVLNSSGESNISKTGISKFSVREGHDIDNQAYSNTQVSQSIFRSADYTGTTSDPKLVVEHSAVVTGNSNFFMFM